MLLAGVSQEEFEADLDLQQFAIENIAYALGQPDNTIFIVGWNSPTSLLSELQVLVQIIAEDMSRALEMESQIMSAAVSMETLEVYAVELGYTDVEAEMALSVELIPVGIPMNMNPTHTPSAMPSLIPTASPFLVSTSHQ